MLQKHIYIILITACLISLISNQQFYLGCFIDNQNERDLKRDYYQDSINLNIRKIYYMLAYKRSKSKNFIFLF
jgi:hypothetical protein